MSFTGFRGDDFYRFTRQWTSLRQSIICSWFRTASFVQIYHWFSLTWNAIGFVCLVYLNQHWKFRSPFTNRKASDMNNVSSKWRAFDLPGQSLLNVTNPADIFCWKGICLVKKSLLSLYHKSSFRMACIFFRTTTVPITLFLCVCAEILNVM